MKKIIYISSLYLLAISCSNNQQTTEQKESAPEVRIATAVMQNVEQRSEFTGTVESFKPNDITPSIPVRIDKILVDVGDKVSKGQLLVQMDISQKQQVELQLQNIKKEYERIDQLHKAGGASQQQLDQIKTQLDVQTTSLNNLSENVDLRSPIDGVVTGRYYNPGEMFSAVPSASGKAAILTVMELAPLKIKIQVPSEFFPVVKVGMPANVYLDIYPDDTVKGKIHLIYPTIDPVTHSFTVEVSIANTNMKVRPGMFSRVSLNMGMMKHIVVPDQAIVRQIGTNDRYIFVHDNGTVNKRKITIGQRLGTFVEVTSAEVKDGENVVVAGHARLLDGMEVSVKN